MIARLLFVFAPAVLFGFAASLLSPVVGFVLFGFLAGVGLSATEPKPERGESYQPTKGEDQK